MQIELPVRVALDEFDITKVLLKVPFTLMLSPVVCFKDHYKADLKRVQMMSEADARSNSLKEMSVRNSLLPRSIHRSFEPHQKIENYRGRLAFGNSSNRPKSIWANKTAPHASEFHPYL